MFRLALISLALIALPACNLFHRNQEHLKGKTEAKGQKGTEGHTEVGDKTK